MRTLRYGLPVVLLIAGFVLLAIEPNTTGLEGWAMCTGASMSVLLVNFLFRAGAKGDLEREAESEARAEYSRTGRWPDESRPKPERRAEP